MNLFTAEIINTDTGQLLKAIHAETQEWLQYRYDLWKENASYHYRLDGFHVVLTKKTCIDREWVLVSSAKGPVSSK